MSKWKSKFICYNNIGKLHTFIWGKKLLYATINEDILSKAAQKV